MSDFQTYKFFSINAYLLFFKYGQDDFSLNPRLITKYMKNILIVFQVLSFRLTRLLTVYVKRDWTRWQFKTVGRII